jgi:hypothetical protein
MRKLSRLIRMSIALLCVTVALSAAIFMAGQVFAQGIRNSSSGVAGCSSLVWRNSSSTSFDEVFNFDPENGSAYKWTVTLQNILYERATATGLKCGVYESFLSIRLSNCQGTVDYCGFSSGYSGTAWLVLPGGSHVNTRTLSGFGLCVPRTSPNQCFQPDSISFATNVYRTSCAAAGASFTDPYFSINHLPAKTLGSAQRCD